MSAAEPKDTRERLLDVGERLFGERGFAAVSVREITSAAGANVAAVNYHFSNKDGLLQAVFERRMMPLNEERLRLLDLVASAAGDGAPSLSSILRAFVGPTVHLRRTHPSFLKFLGQLHHESGVFARAMIATAGFSELVARMRVLLTRALPDAPPSAMWWGTSFLMGALIHTWMKGEEIEKLSGGEAAWVSDEVMVDRLVAFADAGIRALVVTEEEHR
jgi:AcrR family transcriptional regulator